MNFIYLCIMNSEYGVSFGRCPYLSHFVTKHLILADERMLASRFRFAEPYNLNLHFGRAICMRMAGGNFETLGKPKLIVQIKLSRAAFFHNRKSEAKRKCTYLSLALMAWWAPGGLLGGPI